MGTEIVKVKMGGVGGGKEEQGGLPAVIVETPNARFAYEEFLDGSIGNPHTRRAYKHALHRFLAFVQARNVPLQVTPSLVREHLNGLGLAVGGQKVHLAALRHFFDIAVNRHAVMLNPAATVRGPRHAVVEGLTPEITPTQVGKLLASIDAGHVVGLRDRAVIATLASTAARVGAVEKLKVKDFQHTGEQWVFRFHEKGGKSREIPCRHDLQAFVLAYMAAAGIAPEKGDEPLFRSVVRRTKTLTARRFSGNDMARMMKRRLKDAGLPDRLSPHSFRVMVATDLLGQGADPFDVQHLLGHADARTTKLYDRSRRWVSRNLVERISVKL